MRRALKHRCVTLEDSGIRFIYFPRTLDAMMKRTFDAVVSFLGLVLLSPFLLPVAILIKLDSPGPILFRQQRIGKGFRPFFICKFRTMLQDPFEPGRLITIGNDPRITRVGRWLRKTKIDELPQLFNVLKGEMSFVGPRPEVPKYVQVFHRDYEDILRVRPGITDLASLKYRDEASLLQKAENPEEEYVSHVLPDKIKLAKDYVQRSSLLFDVGLILKTMFKVFDNKVSS
jgi:lipopolysaccharide/colanic/teichoic acid biosynthesis glycosyltransferase